MYVRIITFRLDGIDHAGYREQAEQVVSGFNTWAGLIRKVWLSNGPDGRVGGVYLFADKAAADASRETDIFQGMASNPSFADVDVREFEVLDDLTALTGTGTAVGAI